MKELTIIDDISHIAGTFFGRRFLFNLLTDQLDFDITRVPELLREMDEWDKSRYSVALAIYHSLISETRENLDKMINEAKVGDYNGK